MSVEDRYCQHDMLYQKIDASNVDLVVLGPIANDPCHLSCITKIDLPAHQRWVNKIENDNDVYLDQGEVHHPVKGEICLAKIENRGGYCRCKCLDDGSVGDLNKLVYAIDYGFVCRARVNTFRVSYMIQIYTYTY